MIPNAFNSVMDNNTNEPSPLSLNGLFKSFGPTEKILFYCLAVVIFFSGISAVWQVNKHFLAVVPAHGGTFTEGVVGSPRFINPLLAISDTDKSISSLVYSGLLKHGDNNDYQLDLAESYAVSEDGLVYTVKIKDNAYFHDGKPVTSYDVQFTAEKTLDPLLKSPKRGNWEGVAVQVIDDKNLRFVLKKPYSPFLENMTLGILPKHIWKDATSEEFPFSQRNIEPIGSGPYQISDIKYNSSGLPTIISLKSFGKYVANKPYISNVKVRFFTNEEDLVNAFQSNDIDAVAGLSPETAKRLQNKGFNVSAYLMPRVFGAFMNQNQSAVLLNKEVRVALDESIDKEKLVEEVLRGFGIPLNGPIPSNENKWTNESNLTPEARIEKVRNDLHAAGWKENVDGILEKKAKSGTQILKFSISTSDAPELKKTAEIMANTWNQLGASVDVKVFESGDLNQNIIKTRKYDVLLFGEVIGKDMDFYPFWHSSARIDPGLNIALYTNISVDKLLEEIRNTTDKAERDAKITKFSNEVRNDTPTIFTYAPEFIYAISPRIKDVTMQSVSNQSDRFGAINKWYIETDRVWNVFAE